MGCFNTKGCFSNTPIVYGDRAVVLLGIRNNYDGTDEFAPGSIFTPISLPIRGSYNDYGSLENIDDTPSNKILEELFGMGIEDIVDMANTDKRNEIVDNNIKCGLVKYFKIFEKCNTIKTPNPDDIIKEFKFVRIMEHEEVFDSIINLSKHKQEAEADYDDDVRIYQEYKSIIKQIETNFGLEKLHNGEKIAEHIKNMSDDDSGLYLAYQFDTLCEYCTWRKNRTVVSFLPDEICDATYHCYSIYGHNNYFQHIDHRFILFPYKNIELKNDYKKEFVDFSCFMDGLSRLNITWGVSCYYRQTVNYDECIKFAKIVLDVMKKNKKIHKL